MVNRTILALLSLAVSAAAVKPVPAKTPAKPAVVQVFQKSDMLGIAQKDSICAKGELTADRQLFSEIEIWRGAAKIFSVPKGSYQFEAFPGKVCTEFSTGQSVLYIFSINESPYPNRYLVVNSSYDNTEILGETRSCSAEIFGDIDRDGLFEIGGYTEYESNKSFQIIEIGKTMKQDSVLLNRMNFLIK